MTHLCVTLQGAPGLLVDVDYNSIGIAWKINANINDNLCHLLINFGL
jgi:hypothetical protein